MGKGKRLIAAGICAVICSAMMFESLGAFGTLTACAAEEQIEINTTNFPDEKFRSDVEEFDTDKNGYLSGAEIEKVKDINVSGKGIESLQGIEFFTALIYLHCDKNNLSSLDVSKNTALRCLYCDKNNLDSLDVSKNTALTALWCHRNKLSSLDVSKNTALTELYCYENNLGSLDVSRNTDLTNLLCYGNNLSSLDVSKNTALTKLECGNDNLSSLDVSKNTALTYLSCHMNKLSSLDVSANTALKRLYCDNNNLSSLDVSRNTALEELRCSKNNLGSLDVSRNTALIKLYCDYNNIGSLDVSKNTALENFACNDNNLSSLDVSRNTALRNLMCGGNNLSSLDVSKNTALKELWCHRNKLSSLDVSRNTALTTLWCGGNKLSNLDVSANAALKKLLCNNNTHDITLSADNTFDMSTLPGMDVSKVSNIKGGTIEGNILTVDSNATTVKYTYDCGNGKTEEFQLDGIRVEINATNFPDEKFRNCVKEFDTDNSGYLSGVEIEKVTNINVHNKEIASLQGIEFFIAMIELDCSSNKLSSLDVSRNIALIALLCDRNKLSNLDVSANAALKKLLCNNNTHDITLSADNTFDMSTLTGMDVSKVSNIKGGTIEGNILTVDSDAITVKYTYDCGNGKTEEFQLDGTHVEINATNFPDEKFRSCVKEFDTDNSGYLSGVEIEKVTRVDVHNKEIASLQGIEFFIAMTNLDCSSNKLTSLDVSRNTALTNLLCSNNTHAITLSAGNTFDMSTLPGMDVSKVSNIKGGTIEGNILTVDSNAITVKYTYDCGNGKTGEFQLDGTHVEINATNFPDEKFRSCVKEFDTDNSGYLSGVEIEKVTKVDVHNKEIASLQGIEFFMAMTNLDCSSNKLTSLDVSRNTALTIFVCYGNTHAITLSAGNTFDMTTLPGMDVSKVSNIKGGTIQGNILTVNSNVWTVTYQYDCGNGKTVEFKLAVKVPLSYAKATLPKSSYTDTGSAITPAVTVTYGRKKLTAGTDYTVTYSNNKAVGTATVTIAGKGNYTGTVKKTFKIIPASTTVKRLTNKTKGITIKWKKASGAGGYYIYRSKNGGKFSRIKTITSGKTVSYTDKSATTNGAKYQYKIVSYKKVGTTTYESASSKTKTTYRLSAPKIKALRSKSGKKIAVKWTKNKKATGYQIQYATNSKFKKAKTVTVKKASTVSKVIAKLKKNSTYRVRVRAYKKVSGKNYYSAWSSKKSVKVRK